MVRILVADDEMLERAVLCKTLNKNLKGRCAIFQAENGREALQVYEEQRVQVVILDIEMPGINGIEAAERIRAKDKKCCIIFLTAFDEFAYARKAITVRALDYLLKPYEEKELMLVVEEAIRQAEEQAAGEKESDITGGHAKSKQAGLYGKEGYMAEGYGADFGCQAPASDEYENSRLPGVKEMIEQYICGNYIYDISMQDLARAMNYSEAYFSKLFKQCFGRNFTSYLTEYRVGVAKRLLEDPMVNVKEIGKAVGYGDSNYFTKVFRRVTGASPTEYRAQIFRGKQMPENPL
ncbi:response regulator [Clostridiaceae bacterium]|nr:response regulator [Clostridiaceae bacterium]RKI10396.1 response regulator [bacterium 1XD21-70]